MRAYKMATPSRCRTCGTEVVGVDQAGDCLRCRVGLLTDRQREVFEAVREHGPTSIGHIADVMGYASTDTAAFHLKALRRLGFVDWAPSQHATLHEVTDWPDHPTVSVIHTEE